MKLKLILAIAGMAFAGTAASAYPYGDEFKARGPNAPERHAYHDGYAGHDGYRSNGWHDGDAWRGSGYHDGWRGQRCWIEHRHHRDYRVCR
jgi:hypothetical protein